jgi:hypothetical protein
MANSDHIPIGKPVDPIFPLLAAHRRSLCERDNAIEAATSAAEEDATDPLFVRETRDLEALIATAPTTIAGLHALIAHLAGYTTARNQLPDGPEEDLNGSTTGLLVTLSRALAKMGAVT